NMMTCWPQGLLDSCSGQTRTGSRRWVTTRPHGICISEPGGQASRTGRRGTPFTSRPWSWEPMVPLSTRAWIAVGLVVGGVLVGWQTHSWRMSGQLEAARARQAAYVARQQAASVGVITGLLERERTLLDQIEEMSAHGERVKQELDRQLAD